LRKIAVILALALIAVGRIDANANVVVIGDSFFDAQVRRIEMNRQNYLGRTIRYVGILRIDHWPPSGQDYHFVVRYTFSPCCGEQQVGFEIFFPRGATPFRDGDWVEITGVLEEYGPHGDFLRIRATSLVEAAERGTGSVERAPWQMRF